MLDTISSVLYYLFIHFGSIYTCSKILHLRFTLKKYCHALLFSFPVALVLYFIHEVVSPITVYSTILCIFLYFHFFSQTSYKKVSVNACISMLSFSMNFIVSFLLTFIVEPIFYFTFPNYVETSLYNFFAFLLRDILHMFFLILLFRIPRIKRGIPDIEKNISDEMGILFGIPLLFIISVFSLDGSAAFIVFFSSFILITLGLLLFLWWCKYLLNNYIHKAQNQTIKILEDTISEQKEELEKLSKIIHKDNKLVGALYLSVQELYESTPTTQGDQLRKELEVLSEERKGILHNYENNGEHLPKTQVFSTDVIISYLFKRALEKDIHFDVAISGDVRYMSENVLEEALLNTLLADLGENAIIATSGASSRNILLSIGVRESNYYIDFFDSGTPFDAHVIENLGKRRYTTHTTEGGSGIGLMTTAEILHKKKGSLEIEEFPNNSTFTKRVSVVMDFCSKTRIYSTREEILAACAKRGRDILAYSDSTKKRTDLR